MAKLALAVCLLACSAPPAHAADAGMEQIASPRDHRGFAAATGARTTSAQMSQIDQGAVAKSAAPEFAGRAEVRGIGAPVLAANTVDRAEEGAGHAHTIEQSGGGHVARLSQSGLNHVARLFQSGLGHRGEIAQSGEGHFAGLSQTGESNTAAIVQTGGFASALVSQSGGFNTVSIRQ